MERLISEVSIEQLKAQFVDSGKLSEEVFDQIVNAVGGKTAYATWLAKKVADRVIKPNFDCKSLTSSPVEPIFNITLSFLLLINTFEMINI